MASHPTDFLLNGNNLGTAEMHEVWSERYQPEAVEGEVVAVIIGPSGSGKWPQRFVRQLTMIHEPTK
ncbi:hypothetical protein [Lonsdalea populi]|uniref:hypothetical protein n=1 Tax=Lonsdalea populi TaxID=1172565 RepID=UPI000A25432C|nr:hypothetical protein [Lonsdalea populi]OSM95831.1 hypothetical protein AU508_10285 [Lonsdalea populi]RAT69048.1 hypothetical protein AU504_11650 [Lonsdalea populi]RAT71267.1 hypothetical protein AU505_09455 [Lonsdalea populi]RAT75275.1 hypothetical protein AU506_09850 [Lonsdalea populi]RAT75392.1 hypothetical protein AU507_15855 [Lonsdalea populi]